MKQKLFKLFPEKYRKIMNFIRKALLILYIMLFLYYIYSLIYDKNHKIFIENILFVLGVLLIFLALLAHSTQKRDVFIVLIMWIILYRIAINVIFLEISFILSLFLISLGIYFNLRK